MRGTIPVLIRLAVFILGIIPASPSLLAADTNTQPRTQCPRSQTGNSGTKAVVTTKHSLTIPDGELHYTVRTGAIPIPGGKEQNAAALSTHLDETYGIRLNGIVLISPALDYATLDVHNGHILPYALFLPSYAAGAALHARGNAQENQSLSDLLHTVEDFARGDYLQGLFQGDDLSAREAERLYARTAEYTGLKPQLIQRCRGRISPWLLRKELLREQTLLIGRMDTGVTGLDPAPESPFPGYDPSLRPLFGPFSSAANAYIRQDLQYESERVYEFLNPRVGRRWNWCQALQKDALGQGYVNAADNLKQAMSINPALKVFPACGLFDLATPYFATQYTVNQMHLDRNIRDHLELFRYPAGHMIYLHPEAREQLYHDVRAFYEHASGTVRTDRSSPK